MNSKKKNQKSSVGGALVIGVWSIRRVSRLLNLVHCVSCFARTNDEEGRQNANDKYRRLCREVGDYRGKVRIEHFFELFITAEGKCLKGVNKGGKTNKGKFFLQGKS